MKKFGKFITKVFDKKTLKYVAVGTFNTTLCAAAMFLLYNLLHVDYWIATAAYYVVGAVIGYFLNKFWTFRIKGRFLKTVLRYLLTVAVCFIIAYGGAKYLIQYILSSSPNHVQENVAMVTGMILYPLLNYLGQRFFAFAVRRRDKNMGGRLAKKLPESAEERKERKRRQLKKRRISAKKKAAISKKLR